MPGNHGGGCRIGWAECCSPGAQGLEVGRTVKAQDQKMFLFSLFLLGVSSSAFSLKTFPKGPFKAGVGKRQTMDQILLPLVFANKVLFKYSHAHCFTYHLLFSWYSSRVGEL